MLFWPLCCKSEAILLLFCYKHFVPVAGMKCSYGKMFCPVAMILATEPAHPLMWTLKRFSCVPRSQKEGQPQGGGGGTCSIHVGWGPAEVHIANPKKYMSLKFYTQRPTGLIWRGPKNPNWKETYQLAIYKTCRVWIQGHHGQIYPVVGRRIWTRDHHITSPVP